MSPTAPMHGHLIVPDARGSHLRDIHASVGAITTLISSGAQLFGQLHDMGLAPPISSPMVAMKIFMGSYSFPASALRLGRINADNAAQEEARIYC